MKVAILGARGFLGTYLSRKLITEGIEVIGYILDSQKGIVSDFECRTITELKNSTNSNMESFDVAINLAARRSTQEVRYTDAEIDYYCYELPKEFLNKTTSPNTLVINTSSYIQNYGGIAGKSVDSYGAAKENLSNFVRQESTTGKYRARDLYLFTLYGFGDRRNHLVPQLLESAKTGNKISLSPGNQLMNLLFIEDAVENILNCILSADNEHFEKNSVWSSEYFSVLELVSRIEGSIGRTINCGWGERDYAGHEMMSPWEIPMNQIPNFVAGTKLEDGIRRTWKLSN